MNTDSLKVFIVDDEEPIVNWLVNNIEWDVYNCEVVGFSTNASQALCYIKEHPIDLLLTDICMPDVTGLDLIRCTKEIFPKILIIVISAYDKFSYVKQAFQYGIINYCLKPIDENELMDGIKSAVATFTERRNHFHSHDHTIFRNSMLQGLLNGESNTVRLDEQCALADIDLNLPTWQLALVDITGVNEEQFYVTLEYFIQKESEGYFCFLDTYMNLVFLFFGQNFCWKEQQIQTFLSLAPGMSDSFICIGKPIDTYRKISASYQACHAFLKAGNLFQQRVIELNYYPYEKYIAAIQDKLLQLLLKNLKAYDVYSVLQNIQMIVEPLQTEDAKIAEMICLTVFLANYLESTSPKQSTLILKECLNTQWDVEKISNWIKHFIQKLVYSSEESGDHYHPYVKYALQKIHTDFTDSTISLQELAKSRNVSAAYLGKLFKDQTGEFFNDTLLRIRLQKSLDLLHDQNKNIGTIATTVGFSNQSYFNKVFRRYYKISPTEYRQKLFEEHRNV